MLPSYSNHLKLPASAQSSILKLKALVSNLETLGKCFLFLLTVDKPRIGFSECCGESGSVPSSFNYEVESPHFLSMKKCTTCPTISRREVSLDFSAMASWRLAGCVPSWWGCEWMRGQQVGNVMRTTSGSYTDAVRNSSRATL
jgi:hypothetical protein